MLLNWPEVLIWEVLAKLFFVSLWIKLQTGLINFEQGDLLDLITALLTT